MCAVIVCGCLLLSAVPRATAEVDVGVGDHWTYVYSVDEEGMILDGDMKMEIIGQDSFGGDEVFVIEISGSGEMSGEIEDLLDLSGEFSLTGIEKRLTSNYSFAWSEMMFTITAEVPGLTMTMEMGTRMTADPVMDDYIGDDPLEGGTEVVSNSTVSVEQWFSFLTTNDTEEEELRIMTVMTVADATQTVTVPAGTFECWKVTMESRIYYGVVVYDSEYTTLYYSEKVKNYVRMEGDAVFGGLFSSVELESYSGGDGGVASFLSDNWWLLVLIVVVVVVVVLLLLVTRRGRKSPTPAPPQQPGYQYQAPPPSSPPPSGPSG